MALADASFLLFWLLAIGLGQRFLERPGPTRAWLLGLAVGAAQLFKYNGWLAGVIVASSAAVWLLIHPGPSGPEEAAATWGWGFAALLVAAILYWPWFRFVESHGGYPALLAHHRSYLGGWSAWPGHLSVQLGQARALSGGPAWLASGGLAAALGMSIVAGDYRAGRRFVPRIPVEVFCLMTLSMVPHLTLLVPLLGIASVIMFRSRMAAQPVCVLGVAWLTLSVLTPFYHPYARLWLPIEAWGGCSWRRVHRGSITNRSRGSNRRTDEPTFRPLLAIALSCHWRAPAHDTRLACKWDRSPGVLEPSDSLRQACRSLLASCPESSASSGCSCGRR